MASEDAKPDGISVEATHKSLTVLNEIGDRDGVRFNELVDLVEMSKSTLYHHLSTLRAHDYVVKSDGVYRLGLRLFEHGCRARRDQRLFEICKPRADALAEEIDESVQLVVEERGYGVYIYRAGDREVGSRPITGTRLPIHATASGKAILSELPSDRVEALAEENDLAALTENTITGVEALQDELVEVRERGYALDDEECFPGIRCVSKPVVTAGGSVLGAVSVSGLVAQIDDHRFRNELPEHLTTTAAVAQLDDSYSSIADLE